MFKKICFSLFVLFTLKSNKIFSQATCTGSLGTPLINITFGQGNNPGAPFSVSVPGAVTTYNYVSPTGTPPQNIIIDGDYSLINQVPPNPGWLAGGTDHTNNTNGYMAFFNAAPNPGEFYRQTVTGLCSGTTYEFAAWILNAINSNVIPNAVPPNVTFKIFNPGNLVVPLITFSTGDIAASNTIIWHRYSTLFTTPPGINSVILTLSNNNIGGNNFVGNDLALDDITFRACGPLTVASFSGTSILNTLSICNNIPYTLYGTVGAGLNTPAYQWQISTDNGITWTNILGATSLNYNSPGNIAGLYKFRLQSQESGNIGSSFCKFYSTSIDLTVTLCTVCNSFIADAGLDTTFCTTGSSVTKRLHATGGTNFSWSPATLLDNSISPNPIATVNSTTKFYVTVSNALGCTGIDSVTIYINTIPNLITNNSNICEDSLLTLTSSGAYTYSWSPGILVNDSTLQNPVFLGNQSTSLLVTGSSVNGCKKSSVVNVNVKPLPQIVTIPDSVICSIQNITLTTTGGTSYLWQTGFQLNDSTIASPLFSGNLSQQYIVTGTLNGCSNRDTLNISVNTPNSLRQPPNKSFCKNQSIQLEGFNGNNVEYIWVGNNLSNSNSNNPIANPNQTSTYNVTIFDKYCNYDSIFNVLVTVLPLPTILATKSNDINCIVPTLQLKGFGAVSYLWSPAASLNNFTINNPTGTPLSTTQYFVTGTDNNGCTDTASVIVKKDNSLGLIDLPNTFTPNKDNKNDCFHVLISGEIKNFTLLIHNRWGEKVFETHNINDCWNGKYKGMDVEIGNYVYYLSAKTLCGEFSKKGNLLLIR